MASEPLSYDLFRSAERSAMHLEMRDAYTPSDPDWLDWQAGKRFDPAEREEWRGFARLISATVARGVSVRRARIVSEPVTDYIRYEYDVTAGHNLAAGEQVRWLPAGIRRVCWCRRQTSGCSMDRCWYGTISRETARGSPRRSATTGRWPGSAHRPLAPSGSARSRMRSTGPPDRRPRSG